MSNTVYLDHVAISNFRGYGRDFRLTLPSTAGVTILSGPNGLGKTSFFEAIEWAMTGTVHRLSELGDSDVPPPSYLGRRHSTVDMFSVGLHFSDGSDIVRTQQLLPTAEPPAAVGTAVEDVASILRGDSTQWQVTASNLADYLRLTHFHPQSASIRFVSLDAKKRWIRVSPLAGTDRFDRVRRNITHAKYGLTSEVKHCQSALEAAESKMREWQEKTARLLARQSTAANLRGAMTPDDAVRALRELGEAHGLLGSPGASAGNQNVEELVSSIRTELQKTLGRLRSIAESLDQLGDLPSQYAHAQAAREHLSGLLVALARDLSTAEADLTTAASEAAAARVTRERREQDLEVGRRVQRATQDYRRDLAELTKAQAAFDTARSVYATAVEALARSEGESNLLAERLTRRAQIEATREQSSREIVDLDNALLRRQQFHALANQRAREVDQLVEVQSRLDEARTLEREISGELQLVVTEGTRLDQQLAEEQKRLSRLASAVSEIAAHVRDDDLDCPVCSSAFEFGVLRRRILGNLQTALGQTRAIASAMADVRVRGEEIGARQRQVDAMRVELDRERRGHEAMIRQVDSASAPLLRDDLTALAIANQDEVEQRQRTAKKIVADAAAALANTPEPDAATVSRVRAETLRLRADRELRRIEVSSSQASLDDLTARVVRGRTLVPREDADLDAVDVENAENVAALVRSHEAAVESALSAEKAMSASRERAAIVRSESERASRELRLCTEQIGELRSRWIRSELAGEPTVTALVQMAESVASRIAQLNSAESGLSSVAAGVLAWGEQVELRELEEDLARLSAGLTLPEHGDRLARDVRAAASRCERAISVQESVETLSDGLAAVSATFDSAALRPFAALLRRFLRALVRDQNFHGITAEHQRVRGGSNLLRLAIGDGGPSAELLLSEGQLGEVSLAAILTASCLYPWSRWPALLLDDPMQYHDLVHSTAFFETLRNLVMFRGVQAIVSMHDSEQASYFRRKLESCAVPCVECEYVASGEEGTIVRTLER